MGSYVPVREMSENDVYETSRYLATVASRILFFVLQHGLLELFWHLLYYICCLQWPTTLGIISLLDYAALHASVDPVLKNRTSSMIVFRIIHLWHRPPLNLSTVVEGTSSPSRKGDNGRPDEHAALTAAIVTAQAENKVLE